MRAQATVTLLQQLERARARREAALAEEQARWRARYPVELSCHDIIVLSNRLPRRMSVVFGPDDGAAVAVSEGGVMDGEEDMDISDGAEGEP